MSILSNVIDTNSKSFFRFLPDWVPARWSTILLFTLAYTALYMAWTFFNWGGEALAPLIGNTAGWPIILISVYIVWWATNQISQPAIKRTWRFINLGMVSWFVGDVVWSIYDLILKITPYPSPSDIFYLGSYILFAIGITQLPIAKVSGSEKWQKRFDLTLATIIAGGLLWFGVINPSLTNAEEFNWFTFLVLSAYPIADFIVIVTIINLFVNKINESTRNAMAIFAVGIISWIWSDINFAVAGNTGEYITSPISLIDTFWYIGFIFFAFASLYQTHIPVKQKSGSNNYYEVLRVSIQLVFSVYITFLVIYIGLLFVYPVWQVIAVTGIIILSTIVSFNALRNFQKGKTESAIWLTLISLFIVSIFVPILVSTKLGLVFAIGLPVLTIIITSKNLPTSQSIRAVIATLFFGFLSYTLDIVGNDFRFVLPFIEQIASVIGIVALVTFVAIAINRFRDFPLTIKLMLIFLGVTTLTVGIISVITLNTIRARSEQSQGNAVKQHSQQVASAISTEIEKAIDSMETLALSQVLQDELENSPILPKATINNIDAEWQTAVDNGNQQAPVILNVLNNPIILELNEFEEILEGQFQETFITNKYGSLIATTNVTSDFYQADEEWWQISYNNGNGDYYISNPIYDESADSTGIIIAVPVYSHGNKNKVVGILRAFYTIEGFEKILTAGLFERTGFVDVYFSNGIEAEIEFDSADPSNHELIFEEAVFDTSVLPAANAETQYTQSIHDDDPVIIAGSLVNSTNEALKGKMDELAWITVARINIEEIEEESIQASRTSLLTGIVILFISAVLAVLASQFFIQPILILTNATQELSSGNLDARPEIDSSDEIGQLADSFGLMANQIQDSFKSLNRRATEIATVAEVSRRLSTILDKKQLVSEVVEQVKSAFSYYHVHIYLIDKESGDLVMAGGTGSAGKTMLDKNHRIRKGTGLVGRATETNKPVLVSDTNQDSNWLPNPLLPETASEIAVPISIGQEVLGVLDVQHNIVNGLQQEDVNLLQSLANQTAIALQNAESYAQAQAQAEREAFVASVGQKIQSATSIDAVLQIVAREVGQVVDSPITVAQFNPHQNLGRQNNNEF